MSALAATPAAPAGQPFTYKKVGERELKLFVSKPADWKAEDKRPAIVFFHGGGWVGGTPSQFNEQCKYFASRGMVCATVDYRLLDVKTKETPLTCVQDAKSARRWVRSHAKELGIDPSRIAAGGGSAGGHLAAFCGMVEGKDDSQDDLAVSPKANALVLFNPVFNNGPEQWGHARVGEQYKEFSPAHNITRDDPPAIIFLGSEDALISVETTKAFQTELQNLGVKCEFHVYDGQKHGFYGKSNANGKYFYETVTAADKFLAGMGWLTGPPTLEPPAPKVP
jgi:acetyl esterase